MTGKTHSLSSCNPVRPYTRSGKLLVGVLRQIYALLALFSSRYSKDIWPHHHEDPLYMSTAERIYLGYKYYYRPMPEAETGTKIADQFRDSPARINLPKGFSPESTISLSAGGDLMPYESIRPSACGHLWDEAGDWFFGSDIVVANLETPIDRTKPVSLVPEVMLNDMYFNGDEAMFDLFSGNGKYRGYDLLSVANNHSLDQGIDGLIRTMEFLNEKSVAYCGATHPAQDKQAATIIERRGIKLAFIGATFSLNAVRIPIGSENLVNLLPLNRESPDIQLLVDQAVAARAEGVDFLVLMLHMGPAYQAYPGKIIRDNMLQICAQTGADLILGGHPHNAQPAEIIDYVHPASHERKQALIIYSQADFIAYDIYKWCHLPLLLRLEITKGLINGQKKTFISGISFRLFYMYAQIQHHKITQLRLIDFNRIDKETIQKMDAASQLEIEELRLFANECLLPGLIGKNLG
jgi:poly-gamma-glutamate synthesis protein (capsule biosynthesis protein)